MKDQQTAIIERPISGQIAVFTPFVEGGSRKFLKELIGSRSRLDWDKERKRWLMSRQHMAKVIDGCLRRWSRVELRRQYLETQRCDVRCQQAKGDDCECSCMGLMHGSRAVGGGWLSGFRRVGETTLVTRGAERWVVLLLELANDNTATQQRPAHYPPRHSGRRPRP
ncbi:hypothetical protein [Streptomyces sp. 5-10]|uniref:hypothetical protein n=1 Tax=Streptomyces sp. 5-10 TaxID=878925 RepID=UPI00168AA550|nr:hypothetical protein [Streptomyces sp. 5-10]MBD3004674.1 hypothetical protein [Streptomyces sp. 5-10]